MLGQTLAHFKILDKLGEGGMGVVYMARDTKLGRDVALKILPAAFAGDTDRMARFQREAQVLAALNHPNIAAIYGTEENALVMELVDGPTLAARIVQGAMPLDEALAIARQIADALEAAHDKGITHRDLKPANIKVTPDGTVKVLDFGLAKAAEAAPAAGDSFTSPTLTLEATRMGVIMGTAAYMAPEQARGHAVDKRADIWAFGVVLYEMLTGRRMFSGETVSDTLAAVLRAEVDWGALPAATPPWLRRLLAHCLERDRKKRLRDIGDAWLGEAETAAPAPVPRRLLPWAVAGLLAAALAVTLGVLWLSTRPVEHPLMRFDVSLETDVALTLTGGASMVLSPDGTRLVYYSRGSDGKARLYARRLDQPKAAPLYGTEGADAPFFSPDGQWVAFFAGGKLKKIAVGGGAAVDVCDASSGRGGSWGDNDEIVAALSSNGGLSRVPAAGGTPVPLTKPDSAKGETSHRWPQILPGGRVVVFVAGAIGRFEQANIEALSLDTGRRTILQRGGMYGRYLPSGHLVWLHQGALFAAPMDAGRLELTGPPTAVLEEVDSSPGGASAEYAFSMTGTLVYLARQSLASDWSIYWLESTGKTRPLRTKPARCFVPDFSPDGKRLAFVMGSENIDIWVYEWERDKTTRLTFAPGVDWSPVWSPDGRHIAYSSDGVSWMRADGSGAPHRLIESRNRPSPASFTPDGRRLAYTEVAPATGRDIWTAPLEGDPDQPRAGKPELFLGTSFNEGHPAFSPDGRWLAYQSDETGTDEVYVRPFPAGGGKWQISTGGGEFPVWSRNGRALFYRTPDSRIMVTGYTAKGDTFATGKTRLWSEKQFTATRSWRNFALAPDGNRFAVMLAPEGSGAQNGPDRVTFLLNFFDELRRKAPPGASR